MQNNVNEIEKLIDSLTSINEKDVNLKFKEICTKTIKKGNWKDTLKIYNNSVKYVQKIKKDFISEIKKCYNYYSMTKDKDKENSFINKFNELWSEISNKVKESEKLIQEIIPGRINEMGKIARDYAHDPKLLSMENKKWKDLTPERYIEKANSEIINDWNKSKNNLQNKLNDCKKKIHNKKKDISKGIGVLGASSVKRNVEQTKESSPLTMLKNLKNAIMGNEELTSETTKILNRKDKTLKDKVEMSIRKVTQVEWGKLSAKITQEQTEDFLEKIQKTGLKIVANNLNQTQKVVNKNPKSFIECYKNYRSEYNKLLKNESLLNKKKYPINYYYWYLSKESFGLLFIHSGLTLISMQIGKTLDDNKDKPDVIYTIVRKYKDNRTKQNVIKWTFAIVGTLISITGVVTTGLATLKITNDAISAMKNIQSNASSINKAANDIKSILKI